MTTDKTIPGKRGRKSFGETPMSPAERKRRSRELQRAAGVRMFSMQLEGLHLQYVEAAATVRNASPAEILHDIVQNALDRHVGVQLRCERMSANGATDDEIEQFVTTYLMPPLPPMPELATGTPTEPKLAEVSDERTIMGQEVK